MLVSRCCPTDSEPEAKALSRSLLPAVPFAQALLSTSPSSTSTVRPLAGTKPRSWLAHDLPARLLSKVAPVSLHPLLAAPAVTNARLEVQDRSHFWRDPSFDWDDPMPFLALVGLQAPMWLIRQLRKGKGWSRINVSTGRVFEC